MANQNSPSLYERLGGVYSIATVVDDFVDRIMVDPRLNAKPEGRRGSSSSFPVWQGHSAASPLPPLHRSRDKGDPS